MYTNRPDQSNLLFFSSQGKAFCQVCLTVLPTNGFNSHRHPAARIASADLILYYIEIA